jgi:hypothetical protein
MNASNQCLHCLSGKNRSSGCRLQCLLHFGCIGERYSSLVVVVDPCLPFSRLDSLIRRCVEMVGSGRLALVTYCRREELTCPNKLLLTEPWHWNPTSLLQHYCKIKKLGSKHTTFTQGLIRFQRGIQVHYCTLYEVGHSEDSIRTNHWYLLPIFIMVTYSIRSVWLPEFHSLTFTHFMFSLSPESKHFDNK